MLTFESTEPYLIHLKTGIRKFFNYMACLLLQACRYLFSMEVNRIKSLILLTTLAPCHMTESLSTPIGVNLSPRVMQEYIQTYRWVCYSIYSFVVLKVNSIPFSVKRYISRHQDPTYSEANVSWILGWM